MASLVVTGQRTRASFHLFFLLLVLAVDHNSLRFCCDPLPRMVSDVLVMSSLHRLHAHRE